MRTLLIGATGFTGMVTARRLLKGGHDVAGLARNEGNEKTLADAGVKSVKGDVLKPETIVPLLPNFDAVMSLVRVDLPDELKAVKVMLDALEGTGKRFVFTSGTGVMSIKTEGEWDETSFAEDDPFTRSGNAGRRVDTEDLVRAASKRGVHGMVVRPPLIWGPGGIARSIMCLHASARSGAVAYLGRGLNMTSNIHVEDLAEILVLAMEKGVSGALYHAVSGEQSWRAMALEVARLRGLPTRSVGIEEAEELFGKAYTNVVFRCCNRTRCPRTRKDLGWTPHPDRLDFFAELARPEYMSNTGQPNTDFEKYFPKAH
jgi:nucleoside-diphosphate-sugar epimerase